VLPDFVTAEAIAAGALKPVLSATTIPPVHAHALYRTSAAAIRASMLWSHICARR
jgi:hypothetical protein